MITTDGAAVMAHAAVENPHLRHRHRNLAIVLGLVASAVSVGVLYSKEGNQPTKVVKDGCTVADFKDSQAAACCACPESGEDKVLRVVFISMLIGIATGGVMYVISEGMGVHHAAKDSREASRQLHNAALQGQMDQVRQAAAGRR